MARALRDTNDKMPGDKGLSLSTALPVWVVGSVAGWVVIAALLMAGTGLVDTNEVASDPELQGIVDFETAAGSD